MVCVYCGQDTHVTNSRAGRQATQVWRRRQCLSCGALFTTREIADYAAAWAVKDSSGRYTPFLREKLLLSLYGSCQHRPQALADALALTDTVIKKLSSLLEKGVLDSRAIRQAADVTLHRFDKAAASHYRAYHH